MSKTMRLELDGHPNAELRLVIEMWGNKVISEIRIFMSFLLKPPTKARSAWRNEMTF